MNRTALKIFIGFIFIAATIATVLLAVNFLGFAIIGSDTGTYSRAPKHILEKVSAQLKQTESGFALQDSSVVPDGTWCILVNGEGDVMWGQNQPNDVPNHYSLNDVAKMTRWFLNDYPVYVRAEDYGLLVLGLPKNAVAKYGLEYSMDWFTSLPQRILVIFLINLCLAAVFACLSGSSMYQKIKTLTNGLKDLRREKRVKLREKGIFRELAKHINETSDAIERKNAALAARDEARLHWIAGISHDIRTPLSMIMGYSEALEGCGELSAENRRKADSITAQSLKIKRMVEDLNLISSLEYDMQPSKKKPVRLSPLLRSIVTDMLNNGLLSDSGSVHLDLQDEQAVVLGDEALLERAFFNLLNNSVMHNKGACAIDILEYRSGNDVFVRIADNGSGVPENVLQNIDKIPKSGHGMGLPMAYKIFRVHGGQMTAENNGGFSVLIQLPME